MSQIYHYAQQLGNGLYDLFFAPSLEIKASPENLQQIIKERGKSALLCKFKDDIFQAYTAIEFAVRVGDLESVHTLIDFGADLEFSVKSFGTIGHFYIDGLREDVEPNLEMLCLLLDSMKDVNKEEAGEFCNLLEYAIKHMRGFKEIRWNVIETLLKKGVRARTLNGESRTQPFLILKDAHNHKILSGKMVRTAEEEKLFLNNLMEYFGLEKKYYPNTNSGLTLDEFKFHTFCLETIFSRIINSISCSSHLIKAFTTFSKELETPSLLALVPPEQQELFQSIKNSLRDTQNEMYETQSQKCTPLHSQLIYYFSIFNVLVKEAKFRDCFEPWQLNSITPTLIQLKDPILAKKEVVFHANSIMDLFKSLGLVDSD